MASVGLIRPFCITYDGANAQILSLGTTVFYTKSGDESYGLSTRNIRLNNDDLTEDLRITKPLEFAFPELEDFILPEGITLTVVSTTARERVYRFTSETIITNREDIVPIYFRTIDMALNITVTRTGAASLTNITLSPTSVPATGTDAQRTVTVTVTGDAGATYSLRTTSPIGVVFSNHTNRTVGVGANATFIVPANTGNITPRTFTIIATNGVDSTDTVQATVGQSGDTAIQISPSVLNNRTSASVTHAFHNADLQLRASIADGTGPFQVKYFRTDPQITTVTQYNAAPTTNQIGSAVNQSGASTSFTGNIDSSTFEATSLGSNTFWVVVRGAGGTVDSSIQTEEVTIDISQASFIGAQVWDARWFENTTSARMAGARDFILSDININDSDIVVTHTGTYATNVGLLKPIAIGANSNRVEVDYTQGNDNRDASNDTELVFTGPATTVTGASRVYATIPLSRGPLNSISTPNGTFSRQFNDLSAGLIGATITNFPTGTGTAGNLTGINRSRPNVTTTPVTRTLAYTGGSTTSFISLQLPDTNDALIGSTCVLRLIGINDSTTAPASWKSEIDDEYYVRGTVQTVTDVGSTNSISIAITDPFFLTTSPTSVSVNDLLVSFNFINTSGGDGTRSIAIDAAARDLDIGTVQPVYSTITPVGWNANYSLPTLYTDVTSPRTVNVDIEYFDVTIGTIPVIQNARPRVRQQLMITTTALQTATPTRIDTDSIVNPMLLAATNSQIDVWTLHDETEQYSSTTDGGGTNDVDFLALTAIGNITSVDANTVSGFPTNVATVVGSTITEISNVYGRLSRIRYQSNVASTSTDVVNDTICINFASV